MPEPVERRGRPTEVKTAEDFYRRLKEPDAATVHSIIEVIASLAEKYNARNHFYSGLGDYGFFGVYGIGGYVTKEGDRPDVDLLVATNAQWIEMYDSPHRHWLSTSGDPFRTADWVVGSLADRFHLDEYDTEVLGTIPDEYNTKAGSKTMIHLSPLSDDGRKPIDILYVKTDFIQGDPIKTLRDFDAVDVDEEGHFYPGVVLLRKEELGQIDFLRE